MALAQILQRRVKATKAEREDEELSVEYENVEELEKRSSSNEVDDDIGELDGGNSDNDAEDDKFTLEENEDHSEVSVIRSSMVYAACQLIDLVLLNPSLTRTIPHKHLFWRSCLGPGISWR